MRRPLALPATTLPCRRALLKFTFLASFLIASAIARAATISEAPELAAAFERAGVAGTFVMYDPGKKVLAVHQPERARTQFVPASTFKIANTMIGLECNAIANVDEVLPYGGKPQPFPAWERDLPLREAIKVSSVPVYQELARRIGLARMKAGVDKLGYGNGEIGTVVDRFWLDGPLKISAIEQVEFLRRLTAGELPVSPATAQTVQEITLQETGDAFQLHGKTGMATSVTPNVGWYVGWIKKGDAIYPFALNIDLPDRASVAKRVPLAKECLRLLGAL